MDLFPCKPWTKVKIDQKIAFENFLTNDLLPTKILGKREIFNKKDAFFNICKIIIHVLSPTNI